MANLDTFPQNLHCTYPAKWCKLLGTLHIIVPAIPGSISLFSFLQKILKLTTGCICLSAATHNKLDDWH
eukprot:15256651-Ditylum_brightwellii.AAC.1